MRRSRRPLTLAVATLVVAALAACAPAGPGSGGDGSEDGEGGTAPAGVGIQLFQWPWVSIAAECESTLGPHGIDWVLTSPPQEHIQGDEWWTSYQPVSYALESRLGSREEFAEMVSRCEAVGVGIVADAVINHMTGQDEPGVGTGGSAFEHYEYPGLYSDAEGDFQHCGLTAGDDIEDYQVLEQVQGCELLNLADLTTSSPRVQERIRAYLDDLLSLGVVGFRIDAAKHIPAADLELILADLTEGTVVWHEVIRGGGEPVTPEQYVGSGQVFEFGYAEGLSGLVGAGNLGTSRDLGEAWDLLPSERAIVFVENHDTERNGSTLSVKDPRWLIGTALMLAGDYGTPVLYSGYAFEDRDRGPAQDEDGRALPVDCPVTSYGGYVAAAEEATPAEQTTAANGSDPLPEQTWLCTQRWPEIQGMLAWRASAAGAEVTDSMSRRPVFSMTRGESAFLLLNGSRNPLEEDAWETGLRAGRYCDLITGGADPVNAGSCRGEEVVVREDGTASVALPGFGIAAITQDTQIG